MFICSTNPVCDEELPLGEDGGRKRALRDRGDGERVASPATPLPQGHLLFELPTWSPYMTSMKRTAIRILLMACVLLSSIRFGHAGTVYIYDGFNRLIEARFDDNSWITYDYDAAGNLTGKTYFTSTESFKTITATSGEGGVVWPTSVKVALHEEQVFTFTPSFGYHITGVTVDGTSVGTPQSYTFTNVTADHAIQASFATNTYSLTATVKGGAGGSISPASATVNHGSSQTYTLTPSAMLLN